MSATHQPLFSIVVPCYGAERFIKTTLASIYAQTEGDFEIIAVNDESPDGTLALLQAETDPRLRVIDQKNEGECGARNRGIREARGRYVAFLDSDDAWLPHHLAIAKRFHESHPEIAWCISQHRRVSDIELDDITPRDLEPDRAEFKLGRWFLDGDKRTTVCCVVAKRESLPHDPFPVGVKMHGDTVGWMRMAAKNPVVAYTDEVTMLYRIWGGSATDNYLRAFASPENNALTIMGERVKEVDCTEEEILFYQEFGMVNWWQRLSAASLITWLPEVQRRRSITGAWLSCVLKLAILLIHLLVRVTRFLVRRKMLCIKKKQARLLGKWRRESQMGASEN